MSMEKWNKLSRPPASALKEIKGGRLSGKTDISPQWRYKAMTEVYGECGIGWSYSIDRLWLEDGVEGEKVAFAQISLCTGDKVIPGIGGSMLIAKEKGGMHTNDEAFKMAVTDALSVAMKMLGVASAIYEGMWDGSKYRDERTGLPSAPILPTDGAKTALSLPQIAKVEKVASNVLDMFEAGRDVSEPYDLIELALLDNEERIFLWTFLDSSMRSALKKYHEAQKVKT